jgi:hypothetical protein
MIEVAWIMQPQARRPALLIRSHSARTAAII